VRQTLCIQPLTCCVNKSTVTKTIDASRQSRVVTGLRAENSSTNAFLIYRLVVYVEKTKQLCMFFKVVRRDYRNSVDFVSLVFYKILHYKKFIFGSDVCELPNLRTFAL